MPWEIVEDHPECDGAPYAVVNAETGELEGCHQTEESAQAQLAALYASEESMNGMYMHPARLIPSKLTADKVAERLRERGTEINQGDIYVFSAEVSNNRLDSYFTHMAESTLRNFAREATTPGVGFQDSHNRRNLGYGRSLQGELTVVASDGQLIGEAINVAYEPGDELMRVVVDFYTIRGVRFGGDLTYESTDDFIRAVEGGIVEDVSVGFYGGRDICDVCGEPVWGRTECPHFPGLEYALGEQGERVVIATAVIEDAHLSEVSAVYDGATPGAMIEKAQREIEAGRMSPADVRLLEARYRIHLPGAEEVAGADKGNGSEPEPQKRGHAMEDERVEVETPEAAPAPDDERSEELPEVESIVELRAVLEETAAPIEGPIHESVRWLVDELSEAQARIIEVEAEVERLRPLADDGRAYRADLIEEALHEGVRAHGEHFAQETYREMLEGMSLANIKRMRDDWQVIGNERFKAGRQTIEEPADPQEEQPKRSVPDEAYQ